MSDSLKKGLNVPSFNFTTGALPEAIVFNKLYESVRSGFNLLNNLLGPLVRKGASIESKDYITSTSTYYSKMNSTNRSTLLATASNSITNTFNLARIIGGHSLLNLRYIPGSYHLKETQTAGWPLKPDTLEQQLPFPPGKATGPISYTLVINGVSFSRKTLKDQVYSSTTPAYYVDVASATLYSNCYFNHGESLKYDLYVPNTESYIGAGYNCIPDLSILSLSLETRNSLVDSLSDEYGCLKIEYVSSQNDTALWKMRLPEVISVKESLLSYGNDQAFQKVAAGFEPVGKTIGGIKCYVLPNVSVGGNDVFAGSTLQDNITLLFDSRTGESYPVTLIRTSSEIVYNFTTPASLKDVLRDDSGNLISASGSNYNSKDFFLFTVATSLTGSIAQNAINFSQHDHDGINSKRLSHRDLVHTHLDMPAIPFENRLAGETGGLNFFGYSRFLTDSEIPNDVHPQYLSRLGYKFGGSQGFYDKNSAYDSNLNKNMFFGDFAFFPIESAPKTYQYTSQTTGLNSGSRQEKITWSLSSDISDYSQLRSHSFIFGNPDILSETGYSFYTVTPTTVTGTGSGLQLQIKIPTNQLIIYNDYSISDFLNSILNNGSSYAVGDVVKVPGNLIGGVTPDNDLTLRVTTASGGDVTGLEIHPTLNENKTGAFQNKSYLNTHGAVKLYYEPYPFIAPNKFDQQNNLSSLSKHGFIPGDETGAVRLGNSDTSNIGGLNIGWGNLFFGHREDIFNGRLTGPANSDYNTEASAFWRAGEFNIVTTANSKAGTNTNSPTKTDYQYRDGFAVKAVKGSNIWLSVGGEGKSDSTVNPATRGKTSTGIPGTFALEVSYPEATGTKGLFSLKTRNSDDAEGNVIASGAGIFSAPGPVVDRENNRFFVPWSKDYTDHHLASLWSSNPINYPALEGSIGGVYGAEYDELNYGPGPILDIFSLAPDRNKSNGLVDGNIGKASDSYILGWVYGRPFIRGTYGINFCLSGQLDNLHPDFKVGLGLKAESQNWGPESPILTAIDNNQFIHREFRFWGKVTDVAPEYEPGLNVNSYTNTSGGNINLLYNFGKGFYRWGLVKPWDEIKSMDGKILRDSGSGLASSSDPAPWQNSRRISLGSHRAEDYGSAIRQASFVEAFAGFRSDPYQPYTAEYVVPFKVRHYLGNVVNDGSPDFPQRIENYLGHKTFVMSTERVYPMYQNDSQDVPNWVGGQGGDGYILCVPGPNPTSSGFFGSQLMAPSIFVDQLIRGSEDMLLARSGEHINLFNTFPISLQSLKVDLEYFIGQRLIAPNGRTTGDADSPSPAQSEGEQNYGDNPNQRDYRQVLAGNVFMVESYKARNTPREIGDVTDYHQKIPVLMKSSGSIPSTGVNSSYPAGDYLFHTLPLGGAVGYDAAIGTCEMLQNHDSYYNRFPLFKSKYAGYMQNKMFCLLLQFGKKMDNWPNSPVPYRVFLTDSSGNEPANFYATYTDSKGLVLEITLPVGPSGPYNDDPVNGNISIVIADGGSGYDVNDYVLIPGSLLQGTNLSNNVRFYADSVDPDGAILTGHVIQPGTSVGRASIIGGSIDEGLHVYVWVEFKGRLTLKTITALERDPAPSVSTSGIAY